MVVAGTFLHGGPGVQFFGVSTISMRIPRHFGVGGFSLPGSSVSLHFRFPNHGGLDEAEPYGEPTI
jgi:hypothetical protein